MDIDGAVAIISGGASGLGEATVRRLLRGGARGVAILDLNAARSQALQAEAPERSSATDSPGRHRPRSS